MSAVNNPAADTVEEIIKNNKVVVFSKLLCDQIVDDCEGAKETLEALHIDFYAMDIDEQMHQVDIQEYLQQKTGQSTVPFIFVKQKFIGGFHELMLAYKNNQLE